MNGIFTIDGVSYNVDVMKLKRKAAVTDTDNSGRTIDGVMHRDIIGTYYNYTLEVAPYAGDYVSYDALYDAISAPVDSRHVVFPYGQETLEFDAYVTSAEDELRIKDGVNRWAYDSNLSINFIAMAPQRRR